MSMISWLVRTSWKIQFLSPTLTLPLFFLYISWLLIIAGKIWWGLQINGIWLAYGLLVLLVYGLILFGLAWKREGVTDDASRFAFALVAFCMIPIYIILFLFCLIGQKVIEERDK